jgi:hypothetical protein
MALYIPKISYPEDFALSNFGLSLSLSLMTDNLSVWMVDYQDRDPDGFAEMVAKWRRSRSLGMKRAYSSARAKMLKHDAEFAEKHLKPLARRGKKKKEK